MYAIGMDPGKSGAVAILPPGKFSLEYTSTHSLDCSPRELAIFLEGVDDPVHAVVEIPGAQRPGSHKLWKSYGVCLGVLAALEIPYEEVSPTKWMRAIGAKAKKPPHTKHNLHLAQKYFPAVKVTNRNADALLIALYCQRLASP